MASNKKKKRGKANVSKPTLEDELESINDVGILCIEDVNQLVKFIFTTKKHLGKLGTEFVEAFRDRCSLSIGTTLLSIYETFIHNELQLPNRLVAIYLMYRVRELEPELRRKGRDDIIGHPFTEFFLSFVVPTDDVVEGDPTAHAIERALAYNILTNKIGKIASSAEDLATSETFDRESDFVHSEYKDVLDHFAACSELWPVTIDSCAIPAMFKISEINSVPRTYDQSEVTDMANKLVFTPQISFPSSFFVPLPDSLQYVDWEQKPPTTDIQNAASPTNVCSTSNDEVATQLQAKDEPSTSDSPKKIASAEHNPSSPSISTVTCEQMDSYTKKLLDGSVLSPSEVRQALRYFSNASSDDLYLQQLRQIPFNSLPKFIEENVKLACDVIYRIVDADHNALDWYSRAILSMEVSVQCMEVLIKLYQIEDLDREPVYRYVMYCMQACENETCSPSQQSRLLRIVCLFLTSLIKTQLIHVSDLRVQGLQSFLLRFTAHKEMTTLYQAYMEAKKREHV